MRLRIKTYRGPERKRYPEQLATLLKGHAFLAVAVSLLLVLSFVRPGEIRHYHRFVDWRTVVGLTGFLIITTGLEESGFFHDLARRIITNVHREDTLAFSLASLSLVLSMFLTNDIALFILVPLTLSLRDASNYDVRKAIVFEAIAVNVGSALTPVGNPQNMFLWHQWDISFPSFVRNMMPLELISAGILFLFIKISFGSDPIRLRRLSPKHRTDGKLLALSAIMFVAYLLSIELRLSFYALAGVVLIYALFFRSVLRRADWALIVLFIMIFVDLHLISETSAVKEIFNQLHLHEAMNLYLSGIFLSQLLSNVPSALLLSKFSAEWYIIAYAVNIGGNGIAIGSLANLIALKISKEKGIWLLFHKYSLPFLLSSGLAGLAWIYVLYH